MTGGPNDDGVTSRQIRESSARDLGEATEDIAGVEKVRKGAIANDIAIRGLFHSNLAVSFDGVRMYRPIGAPLAIALSGVAPLVQ